MIGNHNFEDNLDTSLKTQKYSFNTKSGVKFLSYNCEVGRKLGSIEAAVLLAYLEFRSNKNGSTWVTKEEMLETLPFGRTTLFKLLKDLEGKDQPVEKRYIWRNTFPAGFGNGKIGYIIPASRKQMWLDNFYYMKKIKQEAKDAFCKHFEIQPPTKKFPSKKEVVQNPNLQPKPEEYKYTERTCIPQGNTSSRDERHLYINKTYKKENNRVGIAASFSAFKTKESVTAELIQLYPHQSSELIQRFVERKWEILQTKDSPVGYCRGAIVGGALDQLKEKQVKEQAATTAKVEAINTEEGNKRLANITKTEIDAKIKKKYPIGMDLSNSDVVSAGVTCCIASARFKITIARYKTVDGEMTYETKSLYEKEISYRDQSFTTVVNEFRFKANGLL